jgi:DNA uptake protein ComE-like DNA-binding protein
MIVKRFIVNVFLGSLLVMFGATASIAAGQVNAATTEPAKVKVKKSKKKSSSVIKDLVDINSATVEQLTSLSGVSDEDAGRIIAGRPYARKNQLKQKNIISAATYESIKASIVAKKSVK